MTIRRAAALAAVMVIAGACTSGEPPGRTEPEPTASPSPEAPAQAGGLTVGVLGEPPTLDPYDPAANDLTRTLAEPVYPRLAPVAEGGLVTGTRSSKDLVELELAGRSWSDGTRIGPGDVVASITRNGALAAVLHPRRTGPSSVTVAAVKGLERHLANVYVLPGGRLEIGIGGGPFVMTGYRPGLRAVLEADPAWDGPAPGANEVVVYFVEDSGTLIDLLDSGELDVAHVPSAVNLGDRLESLGLVGVARRAGERIVLDAHRSGLSEGEIAAIAAAVDREALAEAFVRGEGGVGGRWVSGAPSPISSPVRITAVSGDELLGLLQLGIRRQLLDAGIDVEIGSVTPYDLALGLPGDPGGIHLMRITGEPPTRDVLGLFSVDTVIAHRGVEGIEIGPARRGPLWNLAGWRLSGG